jgi:uncharacterized damage-inducible protein DinB
MIDAAYARLMARYNRWQNANLYGVADGFADEERRRDRGAFFRSIHETLSHLLWADRMWISRLTGAPRISGSIKESASLYPDWNELKRERERADADIVSWADSVDDGWLGGDLIWYSAAAQRALSQARWSAIVHFFNHQTHHRGQVHAMLTAAGGRPGDTDLFLMPERFRG